MDLLDVAIEIIDSYRKREDNQQVIHLQVRSFSFECNPATGDIVHVPTQNNNITFRLGDTVADSYKHFITSALKLAAVMDLIDRCVGLNDENINTMIRKASPLTETSALQVLGQLSGHQSHVFSFYRPPPLSEKQMLIQQALVKVGVSNITNFSQTERVWELIDKTKELINVSTPKPSG